MSRAKHKGARAYLEAAVVDAQVTLDNFERPSSDEGMDSDRDRQTIGVLTEYLPTLCFGKACARTSSDDEFAQNSSICKGAVVLTLGLLQNTQHLHERLEEASAFADSDDVDSVPWILLEVS